jgi:probable phosphoglycerate mutase
MKIFLIRHGNTFGDDQSGGKRVFMCGSKNNIPLVNSGRKQARSMAKFLESKNIKAIYSGSLIRTWEHAVIIREHFIKQNNFEPPLYLSEQLIELDYGNWAGLTTFGDTRETNEVIANFGKQAWDDWQQKRIIPNNSPHSWQITREELVERIRTFFNMLFIQYKKDDVVVVISSQGVITFVNELFDGGMELAILENRLKVNPGNYCEIDSINNQFKLIGWNLDFDFGASK